MKKTWQYAYVNTHNFIAQGSSVYSAQAREESVYSAQAREESVYSAQAQEEFICGLVRAL